MTEFLTALGLMFVIEGSLYALFPEGMKKMMLQIAPLPPKQLRLAGLTLAILGFLSILFIRGM